jgi:asparagine synthase (glutamine-hydrolysing)
VSHVIEHISPQDSLDLLDDVVEACGEPFGDFSIFPTMLVSRMARREVKVMLSGDGGDELFWGYAKRFPDIISRAGDFKQPLWMRQARWGARKYLGLGKADYNLCFPSIGRWVREKHSHLHEDGLARIFTKPPGWPEAYGHYEFRGHGTDSTANWLRWNEFTGRMNMILQKVDRASMHESLEVRVPLLDKEVVETAMRVDWRSCLDLENKLGKLPLRAILEKHVNHHTETKRGFTVPMDDWLRGPLRSRFQDEVIGRKDLLGIPINRDGMQSAFNQFIKGQTDGAWGIWLLLNLALWAKNKNIT